MYGGKFDPKREVYTSKGTITFVFIGTYKGPFCQNLVESRLIPEDSSSITVLKAKQTLQLYDLKHHQ